MRPSDPISVGVPPSGGVARRTSIALYLVRDGRLSTVKRPGFRLSQADALVLLAVGPTESERARGFTTAIPPEAAPFSVSTKAAGGLMVNVSVPAGDLPVLAVGQIVCTVAAMAEESPARVTVVGAGQNVSPPDCASAGSDRPDVPDRPSSSRPD
ncbi:putative lipoprotein [[Actinomadura] parvosata subsp. kistnae]|nr:putative lipoprotein [Actinomadura parvosata subsp. kistnae]